MELRRIFVKNNIILATLPIIVLSLLTIFNTKYNIRLTLVAISIILVNYLLYRYKMDSGLAVNVIILILLSCCMIVLNIKYYWLYLFLYYIICIMSYLLFITINKINDKDGN